MADQDLRRYRPEAGQKRKPIPAMRMNSVNCGCRAMSGVIDLLREWAEASDDVHCRRRATDVDGLYDSRHRLHQWTDARNTFQKLPFPPFLGTFGADSRRDGSLSKLLQHYEIGHDQYWAGPSKNRLRMGAAEVPYQFPPIVHYLTWLRRHQHQIGCAGKEIKLTISRLLAETSVDNRHQASINSRRHGAY